MSVQGMPPPIVPSIEHDNDRLVAQNKALARECAEFSQIIKVLIASGHLTTEQVDATRSLINLKD